MKLLSESDFKIMPWKNGGGTTCELFRLCDPDNPENFLFRLSRAQVESSGPFSMFPGIDRTLLLLEGNGFRLNQKPLHQRMSQISFTGEEAIHCELIGGPCTDFNVLVKRDWGRVEVDVRELKAQEKVLASFIYLASQHQLIILEATEVWVAPEKSQAIVIRLLNFAN